MFDRLKWHNLKLPPAKCNFLKRSVKFLGHIISRGYFLCWQVVLSGRAKVRGWKGLCRRWTSVLRADPLSVQRLFRIVNLHLWIVCLYLTQAFPLSCWCSHYWPWGCFCQQPNEDKAPPTAFASKSLNHAHSKYPAHRLEFFTVKMAICGKLSYWLRGHRFIVDRHQAILSMSWQSQSLMLTSSAGWLS